MRRVLTVAGSIAMALTLAACGSTPPEVSYSEEAARLDPCPIADAGLVDRLQGTLAAAQNGEVLSKATSKPVNLPGADGVTWEYLVGAKLLISGKPGLWAFNKAARYAGVPLNAAAIAAMPGAAVKDMAAVRTALNSPEAKAILACFNK
jgi:hypothetical protein